ncbi:uncharacterized protein LOC134343790 [Mobula hypostoma]|uniref:uncharacterized protein LOC134343790 n=1 Tax=Mobula hypostoma TaxID=723540 RepID=UPI002FC35052
MQSSTESSADANRAIDGNKDVDARHNSCSQTKESSFPWWVLDLEGSYTVSAISITVRRDCCTDRFLGAEGQDLDVAHGCRRSQDLDVAHGCRRSQDLDVAHGCRRSQDLDVAHGCRRSQDLDVAHGCRRSQDLAVAHGCRRGKDLDLVLACRRSQDLDVDVAGDEPKSRTQAQRQGREAIAHPRTWNSCGTVYSITGKTVTFHCPPTPIRYVYITIPGHRRILALCEVEVFGVRVPSLSHPAINIAIKGTAVQSSVEYKAIASRALDGNKNGVFCTQTKLSQDPWWRLDLKKTYAVSTVKITNRVDCCSDRIKDARILIGSSLNNNGNSNNLCATVQTVKQSYTYICEGFIGRYVNIMVPGPNRILTLCEVEVFGTRLMTVEDTVNLASLGKAIQSSTDENGEAARAIDGRKSADANERSCTRAGPSINPWWMLNLGDTYIVATVRITNRQDCCSERLVGSEVRIKTVKKLNPNSDKLCGIVRTISSTFTFSCHNFMGQYVLISIPGFNRILTLCEVEVFGWKDNRSDDVTEASQSDLVSIRVWLRGSEGRVYINYSDCRICLRYPRVDVFEVGLFPVQWFPVHSLAPSVVNLALRGTASQSSFNSLADADRAIDGSNNWNAKMGSCMETKQGQNPWWRVDLHRTYAISTVRITNRMDCCSNRILGAEVRIGNSSEPTGSANRLCGIVKSVSESYTFDCPGFTGQYVNIMVPGPNNVLALCEVEVFGTETPLN